MKEKIIESLYSVIDETNRQNPGHSPLSKSIETVLYGSKSELDSLGLINFVVAAEQKIEDSFGKSIVLADDRALSQEVSPTEPHFGHLSFPFISSDEKIV